MSSLTSGLGSILTTGVQSALTALAGGAIRSDDALFVDSSIYYFELRLPRGAGNQGQDRYLFPLALNPENLSISEPFAVEATPTLGGGLVVEQGGIVQRTIRLRGTMGVYQRAYNGNVSQLSAHTSLPRSFGRSLPPQIMGVLSGQKLFQFLQDGVMRLFSEFKRDPTTAAGTSLLFHLPRESESWEVIPTRFGNDRQAGRPLDYSYDIEMLAVQAAELTADIVSPDKPVLDVLSNALHTAHAVLTRATAAVNALTAAQGQLRNYFRQFDAIIVQAGAVLDAVSHFVSGTTDIINIPASTVRLLATTIRQSLETFVATENGIKDVPQMFEQSLRQLEGSCYYLLNHPSAFAQANQAAREAQAAVAAYQAALASQDAALAQSAAAQAAAALPATFAQAKALGTATTPEQLAQAQADVSASRAAVAFTGSFSYTVRAGDTLSSIAARFMGDARLWRYLAAANNLPPPYNPLIETLPLVARGQSVNVRSLNLGDVLQIPDYSAPAASGSSATLGVDPNAPAPERLFGTDFALSHVPTYASGARDLATGQKLDWVVDSKNGATGVRHATGTDNLAQGLLTRVTLTRGQDPLYVNLGIDPVVGSGYSEIDQQTVAFNLRTALVSDPRVAQVNSLQVAPTAAGDGLVLTGNVQARGLADAVPVTLPLSGAQTTA